MLTDTQCLVAAAALTWLMVIAASTLVSRLWTPSGARFAFGNRETPASASPSADRAGRAARNMLENLPLFVALLFAAHLGGHANARTTLGANVFFFARVAYWPTYLVGVPVVRTLIWSVSIVGLAMIGMSAL